MIDAVAIGLAIRTAREGRGLSIDEVFKAAGIGRMTLIRYEAGHSMKPANLAKIEKALGITLIAGSALRPVESLPSEIVPAIPAFNALDEAALLRAWREATPVQQRNALLALMRTEAL